MLYNLNNYMTICNYLNLLILNQSVNLCMRKKIKKNLALFISYNLYQILFGNSRVFQHFRTGFDINHTMHLLFEYCLSFSVLLFFDGV